MKRPPQQPPALTFETLTLELKLAWNSTVASDDFNFCSPCLHLPILGCQMCKPLLAAVVGMLRDVYAK